jgi:hypothetical protein
LSRAVNVHKRNIEREAKGEDLKGDLKRQTTRTAEELVLFITGKGSLDEALDALGWSGPRGTFTAAEVVPLLIKWKIPQRDASEFAKDFGLGKDVTTHKVRKAMKEALNQFEITVGEDGKVVHRDLKVVLGQIVAKHREIHGTVPAKMELKVSFDGSQQTNNRKNLQIGVISDPNCGTVEDAMSPSSAQVIWAAAAQETFEDYEKHLGDLAMRVQDLVNGSLKVGEVSFETMIILDMKSLCMFCGLAQVYNTNCEYGCPYCTVRRVNMSKQNQEAAPLRTTDDVRQMSEKAKVAKQPLKPKDNKGFTGSALLVFNTSSCIIDRLPPDFLHMCTNIPAKMLKDMLLYVGEEKDIVQELVAYFKDHCKVYVADTATNEQGKSVKEIQTRVANAVWRRDNYMRLLTTIEVLLGVIARGRHFSKKVEEMALLGQIWIRTREMFQVLGVDTKDTAEMEKLPWTRTSAVYDAKAKELHAWIHELHGDAGFTTYIHIFIAHCGHLIDTGYSFCRFANFNIEGTHADIKRVSQSITGKKNWPEMATKRLHLLRSLPPKQSSRRGQRDAKARAALLGKPVVGKKRGRPSKFQPKAHTLRRNL